MRAAEGGGPPSWSAMRALEGVTAALLTAGVACATAVERSTRAELIAVANTVGSFEESVGADREAPPSSGSLSEYLAYAYRHNPHLRATFEDWRAATTKPRQQRRPPEPKITYAGFVSAVETRVGPQQHRLGAQQWFPWPSKLTKGGEAAGLEAEAAQRRFERHALDVAAEVAVAYWALWRIERRTEVTQDEVEVLRSLSEQIRVRIEVGAAELSDLAQVDLMVSRARDRLAGLDEARRVAAAELVRAIGAPDWSRTPTLASGPVVRGIDEDASALVAEAAKHPRVANYAALSDAATVRVREARADRFPGFGFGVDWIITGRSGAAMPPTDSGKDAVSLMVGLTVPLWGGAYKAAETEHRARSSAFRARAIGARNDVAAEIKQHMAWVTDAVRRVRTYESTLIPQAQATFESVLASYAVGRASVAELVLAEKQLVELRAGVFEAKADYGTHVAMLERAIGRPMRRKGGADERR